MKISNVKAMVAKVITVGLLAGAFAMLAPAKAEAQQFAVGVRFGAPAYGYYNPDRYDWRRHEEFVRHEEWVRAHEYRGYRHEYYR